MFKHNKQQLVELKSLCDSVRAIEGGNTHPLTDELLQQLVARFWSNKKFVDSMVGKTKQQIPTVDDQLFSEHHYNACGCMGPRGGEMFCNCVMSHLRYEYRYDIALSVLDSLEEEVN